MEALRRAIGPDVGLMVDVNTAFEPRQALAFGQSLLPFDPYWFEEPVAPLDAAGHAWLRERLPLKIATGENLYLTQGFEPLWAHRACDYVMPDILRCGGLEQTRQICLAALRHGSRRHGSGRFNPGSRCPVPEGHAGCPRHPAPRPQVDRARH